MRVFTIVHHSSVDLYIQPSKMSKMEIFPLFKYWSRKLQIFCIIWLSKLQILLVFWNDKYFLSFEFYHFCHTTYIAIFQIIWMPKKSKHEICTLFKCRKCAKTYSFECRNCKNFNLRMSKLHIFLRWSVENINR